LKTGQLIPQYSVSPQMIVNTIREIFEEGIKCLQEIP